MSTLSWEVPLKIFFQFFFSFILEQLLANLQDMVGGLGSALSLQEKWRNGEWRIPAEGAGEERGAMDKR